MMYAVPEKVKRNAEEGLRLREIFGRGGTNVGRDTAEVLSTKLSIHFDKVKHVSEYFARHEGDNLDEDGRDGKPPSNGYIAWMLWGGWEGWEWSKKIVEQEMER